MKAASVLNEKTCTRCGEDWPADQDFFHYDITKADKLSDDCHACRLSGSNKRRGTAGRLTTELQGLFAALVQKNERPALAE